MQEEVKLLGKEYFNLDTSINFQQKFVAGRDQNPRAPKQGQFPMINDDHAGRKWAITLAKHLRIFFGLLKIAFLGLGPMERKYIYASRHHSSTSLC